MARQLINTERASPDELAEWKRLHVTANVMYQRLGLRFFGDACFPFPNIRFTEGVFFRIWGGRPTTPRVLERIRYLHAAWKHVYLGTTDLVPTFELHDKVTVSPMAAFDLAITLLNPGHELSPLGQGSKAEAYTPGVY